MPSAVRLRLSDLSISVLIANRRLISVHFRPKHRHKPALHNRRDDFWRVLSFRVPTHRHTTGGGDNKNTRNRTQPQTKTVRFTRQYPFPQQNTWHECRAPLSLCLTACRSLGFTHSNREKERNLSLSLSHCDTLLFSLHSDSNNNPQSRCMYDEIVGGVINAGGEEKEHDTHTSGGGGSGVEWSGVERISTGGGEFGKHRNRFHFHIRKL